MSTTTPYDARKLVYVPVSNFNYVYRSNVPSSARTDLGIELATSALTTAIYQCNSPTPARASKRKPTGTVTSFCAPAKIPTLSDNGWSIRRERYRAPITEGATGKKVISLNVTVDGVKYTWNMPLTLYNNISSELTALGIDKCTSTPTTIKTYAWGCLIPAPAKASKYDSANDAIYSTFISQGKEDSLPAGWSIIRARDIWANMMPPAASGGP